MASSSQIVKQVFGDTTKYTKILTKARDHLIEKYPDPYLKPFFEKIPNKFISLAPMSLCESTLKDLNINCPDDLLYCLGLSLYHVSTHDDIVDETPSDKNTLAALLYSGNISLLEAVKAFNSKGYHSELSTITDILNMNHYRQQIVVDKLWQLKQPTIAEYFDGCKHIVYFVQTGVLTAMAHAKTKKNYSKILSFCENFGMAIQLMDDMMEIEEDLQNGYWSLPIIRAHEKGIQNYKNNPELLNMLIQDSKRAANQKLDVASAVLPNSYKNLKEKVINLKTFINSFKHG